MHVMYTANKRYLEIMLTSIYSLILNGGLDSINLHIVTSDFSDEDFYKVNSFLEQFENVTVEFYRLEDNPIDSYGIPSWRGTQIANARLFFPRIIKDNHPEISNLLYIDSDTLIKRDLNGLNEYNSSSVSIVREDLAKKEYYEKLGLSKYHNSGVIYMNLDKWNDLEFESRIKDFYRSHKIEIIYPDQDLLNILLNEEITPLPTRYNLSLYPFLFNSLGIRLFYRNRQLTYKEVIEERENATIVHSLGLFNIKFWYKNNINPFTKEFNEYAKKVNPDFELEEISRLKKVLTFSPTLFKSMLVVKTFLPKCLDNKTRELSLRIQRARGEDYFNK